MMLSMTIVEAYVASWIEIAIVVWWDEHVARRGLCSLVDWNCRIYDKAKEQSVEAYVASWIEIAWRHVKSFRVPVEAYVASWIEIDRPPWHCAYIHRRGLCSLVDWNALSVPLPDTLLRRGLCSLVDWNLKNCMNSGKCRVEAYVASWIEM